MDNKTIDRLALDIGNSKIKFIFGELSSDGTKLRIIDYVEKETKGLRKAIIEDQELLERSIKEALIEIEGKNRRHFDKVSIGISNDRIISKTEHSYIEFEEKEISDEDVDNLVRYVVETIVDIDEVVIEKEIYNIRVDQSSILKSAIGQKGRSLQADVHLVTMKREDLHLIQSIINRVGLEIEDVYLSISAASKAILLEEDKQVGVALVDIGEGITDIGIYKNNKIIYAKSLAIGGMHYINDLHYLLKISKEEARTLVEKLSMGKLNENDSIFLEKSYKYNDIKEIIDARTDDFIKFISKTIEDSGFNGYLGRGLVITGGASRISNIFNRIGVSIGCSVKQSSPFSLRGLEYPLPSMTVVIGTLLMKLETESKKKNYISAHSIKEINSKSYEEDLKDLDIKLDNSSFMLEDFEEDEYTLEEELEREKISKMARLKKWFHNLFD